MEAESPKKGVEGRGFIIFITSAILLAATFAGWAAWGPLKRPNSIVENTQAVSALTPNINSNTAEPDGCSTLLARSSEIDDGSTYDENKQQGPIRTINASTAIPDYQELKNCARRDGNPEIAYDNLKFGMTLQEVVRELKVLNENQIGGEANGRCCWMLAMDKKVPFDPKAPSNVREIAVLSRCMLAYCPMDDHTDSLLASGDDLLAALVEIGLDSDAKLLHRTTIEHYDASAFETPGNIIRFLRSNKLAYLGAPDEADERHANWEFYGDDHNKPIRTLYMNVRRKGSLFEVTINGNDDEHLFPGKG